MRKLTTSVATALLQCSLVAAPALAFECNFGEGKAIELDFMTNSGGQPLLTSPLRVVGEHCIAGLDFYQLKGVDHKFDTAKDVIDTFNDVNWLKHIGVGVDTFAEIMAFTQEKEQEAAKK